MPSRRISLCLAAAFLLLPLAPEVIAREPPPPQFALERAQAFDKALEAERARQELVGLAVAVIEDGKIAHIGTYGLADREKKRRVSHRTLFRWASVAKPVTAVAALQLAEAGKLDLSAPAGTYIKGLPKKGLFEIPVDALLRHQGGVGHYAQMGEWRLRLDAYYEHRSAKPWDADASVSVLEEAPVLHKPYARYHYTTFGYNLLGSVIEKAGRRPFELQVAERIAKPLGMTTFEPDYEFEKRPHRTRGYRKVGQQIVDSESGDVSWKLPGGGFHSTVGDMARFGIGLMEGKLLGKAMQQHLLVVKQPAKGKTGYASGLNVRWRDGKVVRMSHSGAQSRTRTLLVLDPVQRRGFAIMTNSEWGKTGGIWKAARAALSW